ncbi:MAG TPA: TetR/AcrR family transcriptional regulator [Allosphingosinicella sp.]|nr:TetR/AcrR family transcriptional regulator [Allosphingosinicella sp.]
MSSNLNSVKSDRRRPYHHGDLQAALILAAEQVLEEKGVSGFSLREAARRAGVSPAAPAHHFRDTSGLLTAVAARGFRRLSEALEEAADGAAPAFRLQALGAAYVDFARQSPALFSMMWTRELLNIDDPAYLAAGRAAFNVLERVATGRAVPVRTEPHLPDPAIIAAWSLIHGYARLVLDGALEGVPESLQEEVLKLMPSQGGLHET